MVFFSTLTITNIYRDLLVEMGKSEKVFEHDVSFPSIRTILKDFFTVKMYENSHSHDAVPGSQPTTAFDGGKI